MLLKPLRMGIIAANQFALATLALLTDHLHLAVRTTKGEGPRDPSWFIMSGSGAPIRTSSGTMIQPDCGLLPAGALDYVVVIGGSLDDEQRADRATEKYIQTIAATNIPMVGICTGSFILTSANVMEGRTTCVSWFHHRAFRARFPSQKVVADRLFLVDGPRITCTGGVGAAALAAYLITQHLGESVARKASQMLMFERLLNGVDPQPQPPLLGLLDEPRLRRCMLMMEQNLEAPLSVREIADELRISVRQLERLCRIHARMSPSRLYDEVRLRYAHWMVENTRKPFVEIANSTGFGAAAHFTRRFKERFGRPPTLIRGVRSPTH